MSGANPFRSLAEPNVRIYFTGLWVSSIGTWAHNTAVILLVRDLGGGGLELGIAAASQFAPMLAFGMHGGALADRLDRHRATIAIQIALGLVALLLGLPTVLGAASLPLVYVLTLAFGTLSAYDNPTRRSLATELVPPGQIGNILSLSTSVLTSARIFGPALAAVLANATNPGWVFLANGLSYLAVLAALVRMDRSRFHRIEPAPRSRSPIRDALVSVWAIQPLRAVLVCFALVSTFAYNHGVGLPLLVSDRLHEDDAFIGWLLSAMSLGNVVGALTVARLERTPLRWVPATGFALATTLGVLSMTTSTTLALVVVAAFGAAAAAFTNSSTNVVQERVDPRMRSRALALTTVLFLGSTPIGGPITGLVGDAAGALWANLYGALISAVAAIAGWIVLGRQARVGAERSSPH